MIKKLTQPIPVRLFDNDEKTVNEFAVTESRPVSWVIRTLVHEAINARLGITDIVTVPVVGKIGIASVKIINHAPAHLPVETFDQEST